MSHWLQCFRVLPIAALLVTGSGVTVSAGDSGEPVPAMGSSADGPLSLWGPQASSLQIPAAAFVARDSHVTWNWHVNPTGLSGFVTASRNTFFPFAGEELWASVELPTGAWVDDIAIQALDTDPAIGPLTISLRVYSGLQTPVAEDWFTITSIKQATPQYVKCSDPGAICSQSGDHRVFNEGRQMAVLVRWPTPVPGAATPKFKGVELKWRRELNSPPAFPTFLDVPVTAPYFNHVEALVSAGITGGCLPLGNFCPDTTLSRAEMAVFLTRALGLSWRP